MSCNDGGASCQATSHKPVERRLSTSGTTLYDQLNLEKTATPGDIKKAYRQLALRYHPDKNLNNPEAADKFKEINRAHLILSDERKRQIYDAYGSMGIHLMETVGEENMHAYLLSKNKCFRFLIACCFLTTGCCFGCFCCCCCCCFCCGRYKPSKDMSETEYADLINEEAPGQTDPHPAETVITVEPKSSKRDEVPITISEHGVIAMPPPPPRDDYRSTEMQNSSPSGERTPLKTTTPRQSPVHETNLSVDGGQVIDGNGSVIAGTYGSTADGTIPSKIDPIPVKLSPERHMPSSTMD